MKTSISIPDPLFEAVERLAAKLGISRSELFQRAAEEFVRELDDASVTAALDEVYDKPPRGKLDPALLNAQMASMDREDW